MTWSRKLSRVLYTIDGEALKTLSDARAYAVELPENYSRRNHWQHAAKLMVEAAEGGDIEAATRQVELALVLDMRLDFAKMPA